MIRSWTLALAGIATLAPAVRAGEPDKPKGAKELARTIHEK